MVGQNGLLGLADLMDDISFDGPELVWGEQLHELGRIKQRSSKEQVFSCCWVVMSLVWRLECLLVVVLFEIVVANHLENLNHLL